MTSTPPPPPDGRRLPLDWRSRVPEGIDTLLRAWQRPEAWEGMTQIGGQDMPGEAAGRVALNELLIHGWDLARATAQPYDVDDEAVEQCLVFVEHVQHLSPRPPGLFGPPLPVAPDGSLLDRLIGRSGRDPDWAPDAAAEHR